MRGRALECEHTNARVVNMEMIDCRVVYHALAHMEGIAHSLLIEIERVPAVDV